MRHVVDEVVLHLRKLFLAEREDYSVYEHDHQNKSEHERGYKEFHRRKYILVFRREIYPEIILALTRIIAEKRLHEKCIVECRLFVIAEAAGFVESVSVTVHHCELEGEFETVVLQLLLEVVAHGCRIGTFLNRTVGGLVHDVYDHIVDKSFLIEILSFEFFPHRIVALRQRTLLTLQVIDLVRIGTNRNVTYKTAVSRKGISHSSQPRGTSILRIYRGGLYFGHIFFKIIFCLILFQKRGYGIQASPYPFGELVVTHTYHALHIHDLNIEEAYQRERHKCGQEPYS